MSSALVAMVFALLLAGNARSQPRIDRIDPSQGPIVGGTVVTMAGSGFSGASIFVDRTVIAPSSVTDAEIRFTTPAHDNGYALVKVATAAGDGYAEFLYVPPKLEDLPPGYITTIAGVGLYSRFHLPATTAGINPFGISIDGAGNIYVGSPNESRVLRIRIGGILEPFAGIGSIFDGPNGDGGPATEAWVVFPRTCAVDAAGNVYIPDASNRIRRVDAATGIITTIAGTGVAGFSGDGGPATDAQVRQPTFLAAASDGTLYFIDFGNARVRKVATDGTISTVAGNGVSGYSGDGGPATQAEIEEGHDDHAALALDPHGALYLAETFAGRVRRIDLASGIITTFLPRPGDTPPVLPWGLAVDGSGNVFVGMEGRIVEYSAAGEILRSWGDGNKVGFSEDGTPIGEMLLVHPNAIAIDAAGNPLFVDESVHRVRRINLQSGQLETVGGISPRVLGVPGPAVGAVLNGDTGELLFLPSGELLLTDGNQPWIFGIDRSGMISIFGGNGMNGLGSGPGGGRHITTVVALAGAMAGDGQGGFYATESGPVYYVDPGGFTYYVTRGEVGYAGDGGPATEALLTQPWDVALDRDGNLFIADTNNNRIRRVDKATGIIATVAGGGPLNGFESYCRLTSFCGDGGPALEACLNTPFGLAVDPDGNLFIGDTCNGRIRKVSTTGIIDTFVDVTGIGSFSKFIADAHGGLFGQTASRVWRFLPDGSSWTVAGTGESGFSGDGGAATSARMSAPGWTAGAIDIDAEGNLFFQDTTNRRFRAVRFGAVLAPPDALVALSTGSGQTAALGAAFADPLEVSVRASWGSPAPGVRVDFQAPSSGPSCVFENGETSMGVLTDRDGIAQASCRASGGGGSYDVTATPLGSNTIVTIHLTNTRLSRRRGVRR